MNMFAYAGKCVPSSFHFPEKVTVQHCKTLLYSRINVLTEALHSYRNRFSINYCNIIQRYKFEIDNATKAMWNIIHPSIHIYSFKKKKLKNKIKKIISLTWLMLFLPMCLARDIRCQFLRHDFTHNFTNWKF